MTTLKAKESAGIKPGQMPIPPAHVEPSGTVIATFRVELHDNGVFTVEGSPILLFAFQPNIEAIANISDNTRRAALASSEPPASL